jgi:hypothetical protein
VYGDIVLLQKNWALRGNNANADFCLEELSGTIFSDANVKVTVKTGGNVGIGTTSPDAKFVVAEGTNQHGIELIPGSLSYIQAYDRATSNYGNLKIDAETIAFGTDNGTERMRITSAGDIQSNYLGSGFTVGYGFQLSPQPGYSQIYMESTTTDTRSIQRFYNPNGNVGNIIISGFTTSYATSSDYRLKEDLQDFAGLDMVSKIPVYDFKWKTDESRSYGVMAHELQEVLPDAVSGDKDAEEMQGVDYSKIVPLLVKSIQELKAEVDKLKQECKCKN